MLFWLLRRMLLDADPGAGGSGDPPPAPPTPPTPPAPPGPTAEELEAEKAARAKAEKERDEALALVLQGAGSVTAPKKTVRDKINEFFGNYPKEKQA